MRRRPKATWMMVVAGVLVLESTSRLDAAPPRAAAPSKRAATAKKRTAAHHPRYPKGRSDAVFPADPESTPAFRYAQLGAEPCYEEIRRRDLPLRREERSWPGISAPMRFTGPLEGITFRTDLPVAERSTSPYELFDCRLALALDDFAKLLREEGIVEVVLSSAYRPPAPSSTQDQGRRHGGGLAVDVHRFKTADGTWIKIEQDFHGRLGAPVCGKRAAKPPQAFPNAARLRRLVCGASEHHLFQSILTPNYDYPHRNHFHLELTAGVRWFIVS